MLFNIHIYFFNDKLILFIPSFFRLEPVEQGTPKSPWLLTQDLLKDGLRVLISEEGLFHGGYVSGIRPPDIYGVVVDGERGSRPRILSTEELLLVAVSLYVILIVCYRQLSSLLCSFEV